MPAKKKTKQLTPRSTPKQARSRERVDYILDTTEQLVLQHGYEVVTAQMISEATNISPGVLYHYFPGKHGIFAAVVHRAFVRLEIIMREISVDSPPQQDYADYVDRVVEHLAKHYQRNRSAMLLWQALEHTPQMEPVTSELTLAAIERNQRTINIYAPKLDKMTTYIKALTMETVSFSMLRETLFLKPKEKRAILQELKNLLISLLEDSL